MAGTAAVTSGGEVGANAPKVQTMRRVPLARHETVRVGIIGVGGRGSGLLGDLLAVDNVTVKAVCDLSQERAERAGKRVSDAGQAAPTVYAGTETAFEKLCDRNDLDIVYIATPWDWHVPMAVRAMERGKHAAVEVPAATTLEDCWKLVDTSERTRCHCIILENCCYGQSELLVLNMVRAGLFGTVTHGEAAYIHDLRALLLEDSGEGLWRRKPHQTRNGNLYPTHGLGPVARYFGIHDGDRFAFMVSVSTGEHSLAEYRDAHLPTGDSKRREIYKCGDRNTSILKTVQGRTITLVHDVVSPQPYDRLNAVFGTKGAFRDYPPRVYMDGQTGGEAWAALDAYREKHEHELWRNVGALARKRGGHGGMDFLMTYRLMQCLREGLPPDMDVYDAAAWSAPGPLSEWSVAHNSAPAPFPDFTRGHWQ